MAATWTCDECGEGVVRQVAGVEPTLRFEVRENGRVGTYYLCSNACLAAWASAR